VTPPPSAERQLEFLAKLQRLFTEGDFTATYKFALLMALAELAVELGQDSGDDLFLPQGAIARKFIELYWQQTAPYRRGRGEGDGRALLSQNLGAQAAVINAIVKFRRQHPSATIRTAEDHAGFAVLVREVSATVRAQPIAFLQNFGGCTDPFLYRVERGAVRLLPGVSYCLRRFQPLVNQLARSHWIQHIKDNRRNFALLGEHDDLEGFLFETPRQALAVIGKGLRKIASDRCFYCGERVRDADVDHFVPFVLYPRDLMHNFVLAHPPCNRSKADSLAAKTHLERWLHYIDRYDADLLELGAEAGRSADRRASLAVTRWGYSNAFSGGAQAWERAATYLPVDADYLELLEN
jgi:5-methylcytosine-specific restriction endonuclease McrA